MKTPYEAARTRPYPHLVSAGDWLSLRQTILVANTPISGVGADRPLCFIGLGMLDRKGTLTNKGRQIVLEGVIQQCSEHRSDRCIVWAPDDCTWVDGNGRQRHSRKPPIAQDTLDPYLYDAMPLTAENCWTVALPAGNDPSHICIRTVDHKRIEICPGEEILLGDFSERTPDGERDPSANLIDKDGYFSPPPIWRGMRVSRTDGWSILGPVQPLGDGIILRDPSPSDVRRACIEIAGIPLDEKLIDRCWRAARPDLPFTPVGVLEAA